jgi:hypothetical protein
LGVGGLAYNDGKAHSAHEFETSLICRPYLHVEEGREGRGAGVGEEENIKYT